MKPKLKLKLAAIIILTATFVTAVPASADAKKKKKKGADTTQVKKTTPYEKLFKGKKTDTVKGLFTIHKIGGRKVYFEMPLYLLGKSMLLGSTVSQISDNGDALVGQKPTKPLHVKFQRQDTVVYLHRQYARNTICDKEWTGLESAIEYNTILPIMHAFRIEAYNPDSTAVVFDISKLFIDDIKELSPFDPYGYNMFWGLVSRTSNFQRNFARVDQVKAFADNVSVKSTLTYISNYKVLGLLTLMSDKPTTVQVTRSFILLPEQPMDTRRADPRIGIFTTGQVYFPYDDNRVRTLHLANRWRLEPSDEAAYRDGKTVEPRKQIVFYVDSNFPDAWKESIKLGVEDWNLAFEKIGFRNAIKAVDFPTPEEDPEFDPANLKYNCVFYAPTWVANAMGPSWTDPRTGEIINASVFIHHNIIRLLNVWRFVQTAQLDRRVRTKRLPDDVLNESLRYVTAHEIGHCLGLMHNMASSAAYPVDSLRSATFTQKHGMTASIMDYARFNYVAQPGDKGVKLTPSLIGEYDYYAIKWLYTPLYMSPEQQRDHLDKWISEKAGDPVYRYGKQQVYFYYDPSSLSEDVGDDAIKAGKYAIANLKYLMKHLNEWFEGDDPEFEHREFLYKQILSQYKRYLNNVLYNVGGIYIYEKKEGDPYPTYIAVPRERQKQAVQFVMNELKDVSWLLDKQMLSNFPLRKSELDDMLTGRSAYITTLLNQRINAVSFCSRLSDDPYTLNEYMDDLYKIIWDGTIKRRKLTEREIADQLKFIEVVTVCVDAKAKSGIYLVDPESVRIGGVSLMEKVYAVTPEEYIMNNMYTMDEESISRTRAAVDMLPVLMESGNIETQGFEYLRQVELKDVYPIKQIYYSYLIKVRDIVTSGQYSASGQTRDHYKHLIYKINKVLNSSI